jgi:hypothetical protein
MTFLFIIHFQNERPTVIHVQGQSLQDAFIRLFACESELHRKEITKIEIY